MSSGPQARRTVEVYSREARPGQRAPHGDPARMDHGPRLASLHAQLAPLCRARGWHLDIKGRYLQVRLRPEALACVSVTATGFVVPVLDFVRRGTPEWHDAERDLAEVRDIAEHLVAVEIKRHQPAAASAPTGATPLPTD